MALSFGDKVLTLKLFGEEGEEDLLLVEGLCFGKLYMVGTFHQLIGLCHVEDELVADEFGGLIVFIGTDYILGPNVPST